MAPTRIVLAVSLVAVSAGCVPAGGGFGGPSGGGRGGQPVQTNQIVGYELQDVFSDGSAFIEWNDDYSECGFFDRSGTYEFDAYYRERGGYYYDYSDAIGWYVSGDRICMGDDCYFAEWSNDYTIYLSSHSGGLSGYAELSDGPAEFYQANCGIVF